MLTCSPRPGNKGLEATLTFEAAFCKEVFAFMVCLGTWNVWARLRPDCWFHAAIERKKE